VFVADDGDGGGVGETEAAVAGVAVGVVVDDEGAGGGEEDGGVDGVGGVDDGFVDREVALGPAAVRVLEAGVGGGGVGDADLAGGGARGVGGDGAEVAGDVLQPAVAEREQAVAGGGLRDAGGGDVAGVVEAGVAGAVVGEAVDAVGGGDEVGVERADGGVDAAPVRPVVAVVVSDGAVLAGREHAAVEARDGDRGTELGAVEVPGGVRDQDVLGGGDRDALAGRGDVAGVTADFERELADLAARDVGGGDAEAGGDVRHEGLALFDEHAVFADGGHAWRAGGSGLSGCGSLENPLPRRLNV